MKTTALTFVALFLAAIASAQQTDQALRTYVTRALPQCPGGAITLENVNGGPPGFRTYMVTLRSSDQYCGTQRHLLYSPKTQQVILGTIVPLPQDGRPAHLRVTEKASELLGKSHTASVSPFPLPDGIKAVTIHKPVENGTFGYHGFVDSSERYLIVGNRGLANSDPAVALREALGVSKAARRGTGSVEIIEVSDFQCPTCARAHEKIEPLIQQNLSKITYVRVDLPLFEHHEWSLQSALAARSIQRVAPAKYWTFVDFVFKNQQAITAPRFDKMFRDFAEDHDIPWPALEKIYRAPAERQALLDQTSRAFDSGLNSTPTFIVDGRVMGFGPDGNFTIEKIKAAIAGAKPAKPAAKAPAKPKK
ncbi:MAG: thioredoxin domain-containing protein [Thermoanaerobaculia bacterium]